MAGGAPKPAACTHRPGHHKVPGMKLHMDNPGLNHRIRACTADSITIGETRYSTSLLVNSEILRPDWPPASIDELQAHHFDAIAELQPEVVLLGTGEHMGFPHPALMRQLYDQRIGVEVMTTPAACRTFNILLAEDRRVTAALMLNPPE